ncbi:hypothetical protein OEG86_25585 [Hoeflea alexandrii]|uniref:hypothetical protein n=1 Tax=Hoeflea alexandrii TaxID=288436 RepID=UPI00226EB36E|nr:hypothetical protein [Hoeflea alexandrii]MCY0155025.1 hypothetical protein [Hoeflea alexandrii]
MKKLSKFALAAGFLALGAINVHAEGIDEINPDVAARLYNPDMLDPAQPIGPSAWRDFVAKNPPPWKIGYASSYARQHLARRCDERASERHHSRVERARTA